MVGTSSIAAKFAAIVGFGVFFGMTESHHAQANSSAPWVGRFSASHVVTAVSPDSTYTLLTRFLDSANQSIRMSVYELDNPGVGQALERALGRGVNVTILLEGTPIPKLPEPELYLTNRLNKAGAKVYFYDKASPERQRTFKYFHAKYTIVDEKRVIVGSSNYGVNGHPVDSTFGNREWEVALDDPQAATLFGRAFSHDLSLKAEWAKYGSSDRYRVDPSFQPQPRSKHGHYEAHLPPMDAYNVPMATVFAPDNSLDEKTILGVIGSADESINIEQLNFETYWGNKSYNPKVEDSPLMAAVLERARAGRMVRILLNNDFVFREPEPKLLLTDLFSTLTSYWDDLTKANDEDTEEPRPKRDNRATVEYLSKIARQEGLNLGVRLFNYKGCGLRVLHNKGMVVDGEVTLVSSINWGESAMKFNREAGVLMKNSDVARYYSRAFEYDWRCSGASGVQD